MRRTAWLAWATLLVPAVQAQTYVDSAVCAGCHQAEADSYRKTGMGRSFYKPRPEDIGNAIYYHPASDTTFSMIVRAGKLFQQQSQVGFDGKPANVLEKQVDYILGSGNHSRTYLARSAKGDLMELPLAWYAEKGGSWAMNPGYDAPDHQGFRRKIGDDCMFCHNAYPRAAESLPEGIDCQRCHGPGQNHVRVAGQTGASKETIRAAIVNPAKLVPQRQMDVCRQCHLETTSSPLPNSIVRYDRDIFSYKPGEPLGDFKLFFERKDGADRVEIASAASRLDKSACMLKSEGRLTCTTCHNPHDIKHGQEGAAQYTAACRSCHAGDFDKEVAANRHTRDADCVSCHMPKRRTDDVVHAVMTDHYIQRRKPARDLLAEMPERQETVRGEVALYYPASLPKPEDELYLAAAQVLQGSNLTAGITQLSAAIALYKPERAEPYVQLADALRNAGRCAEAVPMYEEAGRRAPKSAEAMQKTALCVSTSAIVRKAIELASDDAKTWTQLGLAYVAEGKKAEAIAAFEKAIALDPELPEAWNSLGGFLQNTDPARAEVALRNAIRLQPNYAEARNNLAGLLSVTNRFEEAGFEFDAALRYKPDYAFAHYNYGIALARANRMEQAQQQLELALHTEPNAPDTHEVLGIVLIARKQGAQAIAQFREALRLRPEFPRASLSLGAALLDSGDKVAALPHLRRAAGGSDQAIRNEAQQLLRTQ